jgi:1,2-diacylglycerol 3-beta-glucosyltransferase
MRRIPRDVGGSFAFVASRSVSVAAHEVRGHRPGAQRRAGDWRDGRKLKALDYAADLRRIVVVADNCTDSTAARAREAGAFVIERQDAVRRGKGYALADAFAVSLGDSTLGAVVVVDADMLVDPNLLRAFDACFQKGAARA